MDDKNRPALERLVQLATARGDRALAIGDARRASPRPRPIRPAASRSICASPRPAARPATPPARARAFADAIAARPARPARVDGARAASTGSRRPRAPPPTPPRSSRCSTSPRRAGCPSITAGSPRWACSRSTCSSAPREGVAHLNQAAAMPGAAPDVRAMLGRGLEAAGRNGEAMQVFRDVLLADGRAPSRALGESPRARWPRSRPRFAKEGRVEERLAVEEVRACLGDVKPDRVIRLRARRLARGRALRAARSPAPSSSRLLLPEARTVAARRRRGHRPHRGEDPALRAERPRRRLARPPQPARRPPHPRARRPARPRARHRGLRDLPEPDLAGRRPRLPRRSAGDRRAPPPSPSCPSPSRSSPWRACSPASRSARPGSTSCPSTPSTASSSP